MSPPGRVAATLLNHDGEARRLQGVTDGGAAPLLAPPHPLQPPATREERAWDPRIVAPAPGRWDRYEVQSGAVPAGSAAAPAARARTRRRGGPAAARARRGRGRTGARRRTRAPLRGRARDLLPPVGRSAGRHA